VTLGKNIYDKKREEKVKEKRVNKVYRMEEI
jgi:chorismate mutase